LHFSNLFSAHIAQGLKKPKRKFENIYNENQNQSAE